MFDHLESAGALFDGAAVADIGSGTGIFSRQLIGCGYRVIAVEPNAEMRAAAEADLWREPLFQSASGCAEATGLRDCSVDLICACQAFHWFQPEPARWEFRRILRPGGSVALIWNERDAGGSAFMAGYEALLHEFGGDYEHVVHRNFDEEVIRDFFAPGLVSLESFPHRQRLDRDGLRGRLLSSSYIPGPGSPRFEAMLAALDSLFAGHACDGAADFAYQTRVFLGRFAD
ncbi:MAG: class I SAM-dependent methyltransferase [Verrucomicrobiales bacterium]